MKHVAKSPLAVGGAYEMLRGCFLKTAQGWKIVLGQMSILPKER